MAFKRRKTSPPSVQTSMAAGNEDSSLPLAEYHGLREEDVGIDMYVTHHKGFHAIIKHRFSDFIVHEIDSNGTVTELTSLAYDGPEKETKPPEAPAEDFYKELSQSQTEETVKAIKLYMEDNDNAKQPLVLPADSSKERRTALHQALKRHRALYTSDTVKDDHDRVCVRVGVKGAQGGSMSERGGNFPATYCEFVLYKEFKDTMAALAILAAKLGVPIKRFSFAGTKDRRAITAQRVQAKHMWAERLFEANQKGLWGIYLNHFTYTNTPLVLGSLRGNRFTIALRDVQGATEEEINEIMTSVQSNGFVNYYGMQRFGTTSIPTHHVGVAILKSDYVKAVELILAVRAGEADDITTARNHLKENPKDFRGTLKMMPKRYRLERQLLYALAEKREPRRALESLPRTSRLMYVHAYQSFVWNHMASLRLRQHDFQPIVGDLVATEEGHGDDKDQSSVAISDVGVDELEELGEHQSVRALTQEDIESGRFSIFDVLLPCPGHSVTYPANDLRDAYKARLAEDQLDIDAMQHSVKDYSLPGAYRKLLMRPRNFSWQAVHYSDTDTPLTTSDMEKISGKSPPQLDSKDGYVGALLHFDLPPASYATMLLREVTKAETSSEFQKLKTEMLASKDEEVKEEKSN